VHTLGNTVFLSVYAPTLSTTGFVLKNVQTHISEQIHIEMCVYTLLNANPVAERVRARALEGKNNFTIPGEHVGAASPAWPGPHSAWRL